jgi:hypothetical protein
MRQRAQGIVEAIRAERPGAQEVLVRVIDAEESAAEGKSEAPIGVEEELRLALNLVALTGPLVAGDRVLLNTTAVEMGLGSGGLDFVITVLGRTVHAVPPPGHILKLRYTPLQTPVLAVEAPESPHHDALRLFATLDDLPVVCAELHSQLSAICVAAHWSLQEHGWPRKPRIAYIMTEGASLPLPLSRLIPELKARGLIEATITAGQAFGGDYEAVNLYSAMVAAKQVIEADIVIVAQGPGNVGTDTPLGFSGVEQGLAINAADSLGGIPVAVVRLSFADTRRRHYGLSHHTITNLRHIARAPALIPIPRLGDAQRKELLKALEEAGIAERHQPITIDAQRGLTALAESGLEVTTMGRDLSEEQPFFLAAAAAGLLAAQLVEARTP